MEGLVDVKPVFDRCRYCRTGWEVKRDPIDNHILNLHRCASKYEEVEQFELVELMVRQVEALETIAMYLGQGGYR